MPSVSAIISSRLMGFQLGSVGSGGAVVGGDTLRSATTRGRSAFTSRFTVLGSRPSSSLVYAEVLDGIVLASMSP